jgi:hypothetical protein
VTGSAAALEDPARWVGVLLAVAGALLANPDATAHGWATFQVWLRRKREKARGWLARYIPWLRRSGNIQVNSGMAVSSEVAGSLTARGFKPLADSADLDEKVQILDERTERLHKEVGELQRSLRKTEKHPRRDLNAAVADLRDEAHTIQQNVDTLRLAIIHSEASALPIIVAGLVLTGLAPDAASVPMWTGLLVLLSVVGFAGVRGYVVLRDWWSKDPDEEDASHGR